MVHETVSMEGHLIDSDILRKVFDRVVEGGGEFQVLDFHVGSTNDDPSSARLEVKARDPEALDRILPIAVLAAEALGRDDENAVVGHAPPGQPFQLFLHVIRQ